MAKKEVKKRCSQKTTKKEKVWQYIRRNRRFAVRDVMMLTDTTKGFCKQMFWYLAETGYLRLESEGQSYEERVYVLVKNTGVKSPALINNRVFDYNTGEEYEIYVRTPTDTVNLIYLAIAPEGSRYKEILETTGLPKPTLLRYLKQMLEKRLIRKAPKGKYERCGQ
ncbi:MAG: helix-turn-helix domain-containing protein [Campylobacterales bacterium]